MSEESVTKPTTLAPQSPAKVRLTKADFERPVGDAGRLKLMGETMAPQIAAALPSFLKKQEERFLRCLMTECQKSPALLNANGVSLIGSLIQVAQLGLELGGPAGQAYLIPFKGNVSLIIGYRGYLTLAHRSDKLKRCSPRIIYAGDKWDLVYGSDQRIVHIPKQYESRDEEAEARQKIVGYYATVEMHNGGCDFDFLTPYQAEVHRNKFALSKGGGPWAKNFDEMALKTCIRRLCKRLPLSVESVSAAVLDEMAEEDVPQNLEAMVSFGQSQLPSLEDRFAEARQVKAIEG